MTPAANASAELAGLLADNAVLHRVYALLVEDGRRASNARQAIAHVEALLASTSQPATQAACRGLVAALESIAQLPDDAAAATLGEEVRRSESAMRDPATPTDRRDVELFRQQLLRRLLRPPGIPRVVHLVRTDNSAEDLPLLQTLCYRSVLAHCTNYRVILHTPNVPQGPRWNSLLPRLELDVGPTPQWLGDRRLIAAAHQSDVWRVRQLIDHGGFYFDWDLLLLRAPEQLRDEVCVMALERQEAGYFEVLGVSAIGAEPGAVFLQTWLDEMSTVYNPRKYTSHSVVLGRSLAIRLAPLVRVLDHRSFYYPGWSVEAMRWLFDPSECLPQDELDRVLAASTGIHLFCSHANFLHWARDLGESEIEAGRCNLARLMRPYL